MKEADAIAMATRVAIESGTKLKSTPATAFRKAECVHSSPPQGGWIVSFELDFPNGFEPPTFFLEVHDDGTVYTPPFVI